MPVGILRKVLPALGPVLSLQQVRLNKACHFSRRTFHAFFLSLQSSWLTGQDMTLKNYATLLNIASERAEREKAAFCPWESPNWRRRGGQNGLRGRRGCYGTMVALAKHGPPTVQPSHPEHTFCLAEKQMDFCISETGLGWLCSHWADEIYPLIVIPWFITTTLASLGLPSDFTSFGFHSWWRKHSKIQKQAYKLLS